MNPNPPKEKLPPRVLIRTEPSDEEFLALDVITADIASLFDRRGSHWIEYIPAESVAGLVDALEDSIDKITSEYCSHGLRGEEHGGESCYAKKQIEALKQWRERG